MVHAQVTFMMPALRKRLVYKDPPYPAWPEDWMEKRFIPIPNGKNGTWAGIVDAASVQFSFNFNESTTGLRIPKRFWAGIKVASESLARAPAREESDLESDNEAPNHGSLDDDAASLDDDAA